MGNNLAVIENKQQIAHVPAFSFNDMQAMATSFAQGGMFGSNNPHAVLSLMLVAQAEGKHPAQIMQDYHVINNKPAKKADAMLRDFIASGGKVEWHQLDDECADATFSHPAGGSVRITWDDKRVSQAQLGSNQMHKKYPRQMKRSRVVSEGVRTVYPGATGGFYVPEEVADFDDDKSARPEPKRARNITNEQPDDDKRAKAEEWVGNQIAAADGAKTLEALDDVISTGRGAVKKLAKEHADLHDKVQAAYEARTNAINGYDENGEVATPSIADDFAGNIAKAGDADALATIERAIEEVADTMSGTDMKRLDEALAARRREIGKVDA